MLRNSIVRGAALVCAASIATGCVEEVPTHAETRALHSHGPAPSVQSAELSQALAELRRLTAPLHNLQKAQEAGYTANLGCVDERAAGVPAATARGMGYHVTIIENGVPTLLIDDKVELLKPEFLVYGRQRGSGELKLAGFDYFIPASATWPAPENGGVPPTFLGMEMRWSAAFGGWMFHIWPWWNNPDGIFVDFSPSIPLCECAVSPTNPIC